MVSLWFIPVIVWEGDVSKGLWLGNANIQEPIQHTSLHDNDRYHYVSTVAACGSADLTAESLQPDATGYKVVEEFP